MEWKNVAGLASLFLKNVVIDLKSCQFQFSGHCLVLDYNDYLLHSFKLNLGKSSVCTAAIFGVFSICFFLLLTCF